MKGRSDTQQQFTREFRFIRERCGLYRKGHGVIVVLLLRGWWLLARCWDWEEGER